MSPSSDHSSVAMEEKGKEMLSPDASLESEKKKSGEASKGGLKYFAVGALP